MLINHVLQHGSFKSLSCISRSPVLCEQDNGVLNKSFSCLSVHISRGEKASVGEGMMKISKWVLG